MFNNLAIERLTEHAGNLLVAPLCFKSVLMQEMDAEIEAKRMGKDARIILKCNSISDKDIIEKISEASCAGVSVQMIVRGICCIKAGVPGLTENVTVRSIVGRYLEHERVYAFGCGQDTRVYIASGDFLTRNTERRVEVGVRIQDRRIAGELLQMLDLQLRDNVNAREMQPDGTYPKVKPAPALTASSACMICWPALGPPCLRRARRGSRYVVRRQHAAMLPLCSSLSAARQRRARKRCWAGSGTCWDADPSQITGPDNLLYTGCPGSFFGVRRIAFLKE